MKQLSYDIVIIGGGPAGLAAALKAKKLCTERILLLERDAELGGILQQCMHDGFGLHRFGQRMSGNQYAQAFIDEVEKGGIEIKAETMALEVTPERVIYACNKAEGMLEIQAGAVILAMGCRERTASQVFIHGERPVGVLTAGAVQRYINMEGYLPGTKAVILGSGDIGLIMARRMTLEGIQVKAVYEVMQNPGGLTRNIVQCLDDYDIPLYLGTTVTQVHGRSRVEAVTVARVDEKLQPIPGTEQTIDCDLLVLAVGLIPENELSRGAGVALDPRTKGPVIDSDFMTSVPGIFAAGNVAVVFDLVDYVSESGEIAAQGAVDYLAGRLDPEAALCPVETEDNVSFVVPQRLRPDSQNSTFFMRVKQSARKAILRCSGEDAAMLEKSCRFIAPPEMLKFKLEGCPIGPLTVSVLNEEAKV